MHRELSHRRGETANLVGRFALGPQSGQQRAGQCRRQVAFRELLHQFVSLALAEVVAIEQPVEQLAVVRAHVVPIRMKFTMS